MKPFLKNCALYMLVCGSCIVSSCSDDETPTNPTKPDRVTSDEIFYANNFAHDLLSTHYLWNEEISNDLKLLDPLTNTDPIKTVEEIRYHQGDIKIDRWTSLINEMNQFQDNVEGVSTTYGYMPITYEISKENGQCISAIAVVFKDSPAEKAGLKRGDVIVKINDQMLTTSNYTELFSSSNVKLSVTSVRNDTILPVEKEVQLKAIEMYEDPILLDSIYEFNGKKVGYLAYNSFDLNSIPQLIEISKKFKAKGVKELILDLRYNGGGFVITENVMASMYVPEKDVQQKRIFEKEVYNKNFTEAFKKEGISTDTRLTTEFDYDDINLHVSTKDANIGLEKVYGLVTRYSASASEALLGGLMPYLNVELIGERTHGKYCTGLMMEAKKAYEKVPAPIKDWGMYVMVSIYQNALGETPCKPNGLTPAIQAVDNPMERIQLGDINEPMLKEALRRAGMTYPQEKASRTASQLKHPVGFPYKANYGKRIQCPSSVFSLDSCNK